MTSSNVDEIRYDLASETIHVKYLDGKEPAWKYWPYTKEEAVRFAAAPSTGIACWDMLRVRGTVHEHQRNAAPE